MKSVMFRRARLSAAVATLLLGSSTSLLADDKTWVGASNVWSLDSNWSGTTNVEPGTADKAIFATIPAIPGNATIDLAVGELANALQFNNTFTLGLTNTTTGTLTLTTNSVVVTGSTSTATINAILGGTAGLAVSGGGTLVLNRTGNTFTGNVTVDGAGTTLAVVGSGTADQTSLGAAGGRSVTLTNGAIFSLIGTADFNPSASTKSISIGTGGGTINVVSGRTITLDDAGQFGGAGNLTKTGAGVLLIDNQSFGYTGTAIAVNEGTLRLARNVNVIGTGTVALTVASGAVLDLQSQLAGTKNITVGGTGISSGGALINSSATNVGSIAGTLTLTSNTTIGGAGNITIGGNASESSAGTIVTKIGAGSVIFNGTVGWTGNTLINGGAIRGNLATAGNIVLNGGAYEVIGATNNLTLGTGTGEVQIAGGASGFSSGLAAGVTVSLNGGADLTWGTTTNFGQSSLVLGSTTAAGTLDFQNSINLGGSTRTFTSNAATANATVATISGKVTGSGGFTKTGTGVIALSNTTNDYTGTTLLGGGVLRATIGSTIPTTSNLSMNGGVLETGVNVTAAVGTGAGQVQLTAGASGFSAAGAPISVNLGGAGATLQYVASSTWNPTTLVVNAASATSTLDFQNGLDLNGANRSLAGNGTGTNIGTISGVISNTSGTAAGITINGTGILALSGNNTYNGLTTFTAGTLRITAANQLGSGVTGNNLVFGGGTLQLAGTTPVDLGSRTLAVNNNSSATVDVLDATNTLTVLGAMTAGASGTTTLNKNGPGTLKLAGTNTNVLNLLNLSGNGVLDLGDSLLQVNNAGSNSIRSVTGTNRIIASGSGKIQLNVADGDAGAANGATLIIDAPITGAFRYENYPGVANGTGVTILNSLTSNYTGGVAINSGVLSVPKIGNTTEVGPLGTGSTITISAATLRYTGTGETTNKTLAIAATTAFIENNGGSLATPLKFNGLVNVTNTGAKVFTLSGTGVGEIAGVIPNNTAATSISKTGTGTWTLSAANTYTGSTTITAGVLSASAGNNLGTGTVVMDGGTLQVTGTTFTDLGARAMTLTASKVMSFDIVEAGHTFTLPTASILTTAQQLTKTGAGTLKLSPTAQTVNVVNLNGGPLDLNGSTLTMSSGGGNALLGASNTSVINNGTIVFNSGTAGTFTNYSDNSSLDNTTLTINAKLTGTGGFEYYGAAGRGGKIVLNNSANDFAMDVTIESVGTISTSSFGTAGVASPMGKGTAFSMNNAGAIYEYTGVGETTDRVLTLRATGGTLTNNGTGLLKLTANPLNASASAKTLNINGTGTGEFSGNFTNNGAGATAITKAGTGTWILSGTNSNTGATTISGGKLLMNGTTTAASNVTVNATGTLGGTGAITGTVTLNAGGTISPGASIETLATGSNVWNAGTFIFETQTDGTGGVGAGPVFNFDALNITGTLNLTALNTTTNRLDLNVVSMANATTPGLLSSFDPNVNHTWSSFVTTTGGVTAFDAGKFNIVTSGFQNTTNGTFAVAQNGNNLDLVYTVTAIPEPSTLALLTMSGLGLCYLRQRRRKATTV